LPVLGFGDACAALGVGLHVGALAAKLDAVFLGVALGDADQALVRTGRALGLRGARPRPEAASLAARERDLLGGLLLCRCGFAARSAEGVDAARGAALEPELIFFSKRACLAASTGFFASCPRSISLSTDLFELVGIASLLQDLPVLRLGEQGAEVRRAGDQLVGDGAVEHQLLG